jgi:hypothetical protein
MGMMTKYRIAIHGVQKYWTTWFGRIINNNPNVRYKYQPLFSYEIQYKLISFSLI